MSPAGWWYCHQSGKPPRSHPRSHQRWIVEMYRELCMTTYPMPVQHWWQAMMNDRSSAPSAQWFASHRHLTAPAPNSLQISHWTHKGCFSDKRWCRRAHRRYPLYRTDWDFGKYRWLKSRRYPNGHNGTNCPRAGWDRHHWMPVSLSFPSSCRPQHDVFLSHQLSCPWPPAECLGTCSDPHALPAYSLRQQHLRQLPHSTRGKVSFS